MCPPSFVILRPDLLKQLLILLLRFSPPTMPPMKIQNHRRGMDKIPVLLNLVKHLAVLAQNTLKLRVILPGLLHALLLVTFRADTWHLFGEGYVRISVEEVMGKFVGPEGVAAFVLFWDLWHWCFCSFFLSLMSWIEGGFVDLGSGA